MVFDFSLGKNHASFSLEAAAGSVTASAASGRWISLAQAKKASGSPTAYFMMTLEFTVNEPLKLKPFALNHTKLWAIFGFELN